MLQCVPSVPYLEAVLLLRENQAQSWTAEQVGRRLYLPAADAEQLLADLKQRGVLLLDGRAPPSYRYAPNTAEHRDIWDKVANTYRQHLVPISTLIHSRSSNKAKLIADAFIWKKDK